MDYTPKCESYGDSGHVSASFDASSKLFESTPETETDSTPSLISNPKKRKAQYCDIRSRKLNDLLHSCPSTPQASSTLNESLSTEFENIKIEQNYFDIGDYVEPAQKFLKTNGCDKIVTPPSTPEAHMKAFDCTPKKSSSFQKCSSACSVPSPLKEQHDILYPNLKPLDPLRKPLTPQKFREKLDKIGQNSTPFKRSLFVSRDNRLFSRILTNDVVMGKIFEYLSNGDLFRVSMVSTGFRVALSRNAKAGHRYQTYRESHKKNKENYKITPPSSPENLGIFPDGAVSPNSRNFVDFIELGSSLNQNQSLTKCPKCGKPSIVEKSIAQCQEVLSCGFIFCQMCDSFSYVPEEFFDKCRGLMLGGSVTKKRRKLEDLSNCSLDFNMSSVLNSTSENHYHSSGYFSGHDSSHLTPVSVKRDLSRSFNTSEGHSKPPRVLLDSNRSLRNIQCVKGGQRKSVCNVAPVVPCENVRKTIEIIEPPSPPKVKSYSACSKQSKRNLKRLTR